MWKIHHPFRWLIQQERLSLLPVASASLRASPNVAVGASLSTPPIRRLSGVGGFALLSAAGIARSNTATILPEQNNSMSLMATSLPRTIIIILRITSNRKSLGPLRSGVFCAPLSHRKNPIFLSRRAHFYGGEEIQLVIPFIEHILAAMCHEKFSFLQRYFHRYSRSILKISKIAARVRRDSHTPYEPVIVAISCAKVCSCSTVASPYVQR